MQLSVMPPGVLVTLLLMLTCTVKASSSFRCFSCTCAGPNWPECLSKQNAGKDKFYEVTVTGDKVPVCVYVCGTDAGQRFFSRFGGSYKASEKPSGCTPGGGPNVRNCYCDTDLCNSQASEDVPDCPIQSDRNGGTNVTSPGPSPNGSERVFRLPAHGWNYWILIMADLVSKFQIK